MEIKDKDGIITEIEKPIIFFDGVCGLCNHFLNFVLKKDTDQKFYYAPLQGETAKKYLPELDEDAEEWTMFLLDENGLHERSTASLKIFEKLGGTWGALGVLLYVPKLIRNPVYKFIAKNRYKWFGKRDACRLPTPEEKERFLE